MKQSIEVIKQFLSNKKTFMKAQIQQALLNLNETNIQGSIERLEGRLVDHMRYQEDPSPDKIFISPGFYELSAGLEHLEIGTGLIKPESDLNLYSIVSRIMRIPRKISKLLKSSNKYDFFMIRKNKIYVKLVSKMCLNLYKSVLNLYKFVLNLYKSVLNLYKSVLNLYKSVLNLYKSVLNLYKFVLKLNKGI